MSRVFSWRVFAKASTQVVPDHSHLGNNSDVLEWGKRHLSGSLSGVLMGATEGKEVDGEINWNEFSSYYSDLFQRMDLGPDRNWLLSSLNITGSWTRCPDQVL